MSFPKDKKNRKPAPIPSNANILPTNTDNDNHNLPVAPPLTDIKELLDPKNKINKSTQKEFVDPPDVANKKILKFIEYLKKSTYGVVFTGAGISTNTNRLADFRGDAGLISNRPPLIQMGIAETKMDSIMPTFTHYCIKILIDHGYFRNIITSNHDGLHNKSGVNNQNIVDLFGNVYVEQCRKCKKRYYRNTIVSHLYRKCINDYVVNTDKKQKKCKGKLKRTACNMGDSVSTKQLNAANKYSKLSTLSLVLGSSMTIWPFCDLPPNAMDKIGYVLVTRQTTDFDANALLCIHMNVDEFMFKVMKYLNLEDECKQFVYLQQFDCVFINESKNDMIVFKLISKYKNEGLSFIQSGSIQIIMENDDNDNNDDDDDKKNDKYDIIKEYEFQKGKDLNWIVSIMNNQFLNAIKDNNSKVQVAIEWESGFNMKTYTKILQNINWALPDKEQSVECELRKIVNYNL